MGKKKAFIDKTKSQRFRLVPDGREKSDRFIPDAEHIANQQKYGVYYDDDYDYMQHMRGLNEGMKLESVNEPVEKVTIRNPISAFPPPMFGMMGENKKEVIDLDIESALEGNPDSLNNGELEDNFIALAGGVLDERVSFYRQSRKDADSDEDDDEDREEMFDDYDDDELFGEEAQEHVLKPERTDQREIDHAFEHLMDNEYNTDQIGELDGDDYDVGGCIDPNDGRLHQLANEKAVMGNEDYDEELAKQYVRQRMRLIEEGVITDKEEMEIVEVDESTRKRIKWDCESFATQYTNIYNHPTLIREPGGLSRKALKRFDKAVEQMDIAEEEENDDDDDDDDDCTIDDDMVSTVSTFRPKGETPEQRRLRKTAVKEARRNRRQEKKANKVAFAEESRKLAKGRIGQIKAKPL